jgi:hypothetical protein
VRAVGDPFGDHSAEHCPNLALRCAPSGPSTEQWPRHGAQPADADDMSARNDAHRHYHVWLVGGDRDTCSTRGSDFAVVDGRAARRRFTRRGLASHGCAGGERSSWADTTLGASRWCRFECGRIDHLGLGVTDEAAFVRRASGPTCFLRAWHRRDHRLRRSHRLRLHRHTRRHDRRNQPRPRPHAASTPAPDTSNPTGPLRTDADRPVTMVASPRSGLATNRGRRCRGTPQTVLTVSQRAFTADVGDGTSPGREPPVADE